MPQSPTGITLGALLQDPSLLDQQAQILKQKQLAELLLSQGAQHPQAANPNPLGAFLQNLAPGLSSAAGIYLANKAIDAEQQQQRRSLEAQLGRSRALFGLESTEESAPVLGRPVVVSPEMEIPSGAWHPAGQDDQRRQLLASALLGVTPQEQQSHLVAQGNGEAPALAKMSRAMGLSPEQGFQWYMQDSKSFLDAAGKAIQPTETQKDYSWQGIAPQEAGAFTRAERAKAGTQSYSPDTTVVTPEGRRFITANPQGGYRMLVDPQTGEQVKVPIQGHAEVVRANAQAQAGGQGAGAAESEFIPVYDEKSGKTYNVRKSYALGQSAGGPGAAFGGEGSTAGLRTGESQQERDARERAQQRNIDADKQYAKEGADLSAAITSGGQSATTVRTSLSQIRDLYNKGASPGAFAERLGAIGGYLEGMGFSGANTFVKQRVANEQFQQLSNDLVKAIAGGKLGGQGYTDTDRQFDLETLPKITNTKEGGLSMLDWLERKSVLAQARANQWEQARKSGMSAQDFEVQWQKHDIPFLNPQDGKYYTVNVLTGEGEAY